MKKYTGWIISTLFCYVVLSGSAVIAQTKEVEASSTSSRSSNAQGELFYKLQELEREVMDLRGQLEEQAYQIRKLTKQRKDDYVNLDERISAISGGASSSNSATRSGRRSTAISRLEAASEPSDSSTSSPLRSGDPKAEAAVYKSAYALVKNQRFDEALSAFDDFILLYPDGEYAPNAHYWLGELYLYQSDLGKAIDEFSIIVNDYPKHRKAPDALFKLAKAHHVKGDESTARSMLNRVISDYKNSDSNAPRLARDYLKNMLQ